MNLIKLKILKSLKKYKIGEVINIEADLNDNPIDRYWRNRIKDSKIDQCVEVIKEVIKEVKEERKKKKLKGDK